MTEQEFQQQVWRPHDKIVTTDGVPGKVLGLSFTTKSVRAYISGAPEWVTCDLIEKHTTGNGADGDNAAIIEDLHNKVLGLQSRIDKLTEENRQLREKLSSNHTGELLTQVNIIGSLLQEKKKRIEHIETSLSTIREVVEKIYNEH